MYLTYVTFAMLILNNLARNGGERFVEDVRLATV